MRRSPPPKKAGPLQERDEEARPRALPDPTFSGDSFSQREEGPPPAPSGLRWKRVLSPSCRLLGTSHPRLAFPGKAEGRRPCVPGAGEAWRAPGGGAGFGEGLVRKVNVDPDRLRQAQAGEGPESERLADLPLGLAGAFERPPKLPRRPWLESWSARRSRQPRSHSQRTQTHSMKVRGNRLRELGFFRFPRLPRRSRMEG